MNRKGIVTAINAEKRVARVNFNEFESTVSPEIPIASGIDIKVNDNVAVITFSTPSDALIVAKF